MVIKRLQSLLRALGLSGLLLGAAILPINAAVRAGDGVTVFAASSMIGAVEEAAAAWSAAGGGPVTTVFAGSSRLARQIAAGAPAHLYISANRAWMDWLVATGRVIAGSRRDLIGNALVLIVPTASTAGPMNFSGAPVLAAMVGDGRLAMGDPDFVPAGVYAKAALQALGEWEALASRIAPAANVRAALALVERGEVPLGIVYVTDARASAQVRIVGHLPNDSHAPIVYPAALVSGAPPAAAELLAFLAGPEGAAIFAVHGFSAPRVAEGG